MEWILLWILFGIGAAIVGSNRGESGFNWFVAGALLGPLGLLGAFTAGKRCPHCRSKIHQQATVCPKCSRDIKPPEPAEPRPEVLAVQKERREQLQKGIPVVGIVSVVAMFLVAFVAVQTIYSRLASRPGSKSAAQEEPVENLVYDSSAYHAILSSQEDLEMFNKVYTGKRWKITDAIVRSRLRSVVELVDDMGTGAIRCKISGQIPKLRERSIVSFEGDFKEVLSDGTILFDNCRFLE